MVLMTSYIDLLFGSKPRTLPIRPSMTTTMLIFVIASLLTSDPIIHAPHAVCDAMEENHAGPGRTWSPGRHIIQMQESGHPMILDPVFGAPYWRALRPRIIHHLKAGYLWGPLLAANDGDAVAVIDGHGGPENMPAIAIDANTAYERAFQVIFYHLLPGGWLTLLLKIYGSAGALALFFTTLDKIYNTHDRESSRRDQKTWSDSKWDPAQALSAYFIHWESLLLQHEWQESQGGDPNERWTCPGQNVWDTLACAVRANTGAYDDFIEMIDGRIAAYAAEHTEDQTNTWVRTQLADWRRQMIQKETRHRQLNRLPPLGSTTATVNSLVPSLSSVANTVAHGAHHMAGTFAHHAAPYFPAGFYQPSYAPPPAIPAATDGYGGSYRNTTRAPSVNATSVNVNANSHARRPRASVAVDPPNTQTDNDGNTFAMSDSERKRRKDLKKKWNRMAKEGNPVSPADKDREWGGCRRRDIINGEWHDCNSKDHSTAQHPQTSPSNPDLVVQYAHIFPHPSQCGSSFATEEEWLLACKAAKTTDDYYWASAAVAVIVVCALRAVFSLACSVFTLPGCDATAVTTAVLDAAPDALTAYNPAYAALGNASSCSFVGTGVLFVTGILLVAAGCYVAKSMHSTQTCFPKVRRCFCRSNNTGALLNKNANVTACPNCGSDIDFMGCYGCGALDIECVEYPFTCDYHIDNCICDTYTPLAAGAALLGLLVLSASALSLPTCDATAATTTPPFEVADALGVSRHETGPPSVHRPLGCDTTTAFFVLLAGLAALVTLALVLLFRHSRNRIYRPAVADKPAPVTNIPAPAPVASVNPIGDLNMIWQMSYGIVCQPAFKIREIYPDIPGPSSFECTCVIEFTDSTDTAFVRDYVSFTLSRYKI